MSTSPATIDHILDSLSALPLSARKMFGEYAVYLDGKVVALVCDDRLFVKPTTGAVIHLPRAPLAPPYPGAKGHLDATESLDDAEVVIQALRAVAAELPPPKPKSPRKAT
jgi:TfoX/Sxy family transcriptional regulator of competence genes